MEGHVVTGLWNWVWRRLTINFWWKISSLAIAVLLWVAVGGEPELVTIQAVPVLYRNLPKGLLLLISDSPDEIRVQLRGHSGTLGRAALSEVFASLDLAGVTAPGEQTFTLSASDFSLPSGVSFLRAAPSQLRLRFDRSGTKDVRVVARLDGSVPAGYRIAGQIVTPDHLSISGPEQRVSAITAADTDVVEVGSLTRSTDIKVNAFVADARVQFTSPPVVTVHLTIEKTGQNP
jgi:YbbR domain-containing protein